MRDCDDTTTTFCASEQSFAAEDRADKKRMKSIKRDLEGAGLGATVHIEDATRCRDRWRIPLSFSCDLVRLEIAHFAAVKRLGASLVVEECFSDDQMNAFYVEIPRTRLRGWYALQPKDRALCIVYCTMMVASCIGVAIHVFP